MYRQQPAEKEDLGPYLDMAGSDLSEQGQTNGREGPDKQKPDKRIADIGSDRFRPAFPVVPGELYSQPFDQTETAEHDQIIADDDGEIDNFVDEIVKELDDGIDELAVEAAEEIADAQVVLHQV